MWLFYLLIAAANNFHFKIYVLLKSSSLKKGKVFMFIDDKAWLGLQR